MGPSSPAPTNELGELSTDMSAFLEFYYQDFRDVGSQLGELARPFHKRSAVEGEESSNDDIPRRKRVSYCNHTKDQIWKLIQEGSEQVQLVEVTGKRGAFWPNYRQILVNGVLAQFVHCNNCKGLIKHDGSGTSTLTLHLNSDKCKMKGKKKPNQVVADKATKNKMPTAARKLLVREAVKCSIVDQTPFSLFTGTQGLLLRRLSFSVKIL